MAQSSSNELVRQLFANDDDDTPRHGGSSAVQANSAQKRSATVSHQFVADLRLLIDKMMKCMAHFVRCIKPNTEQAPSKFIDDFVNGQLRYTGRLTLYLDTATHH